MYLIALSSFCGVVFVCLFLEVVTFSVYDLSAGTRWPTSHSRPAAGASWWVPGSSRATSRSWTASLEYSPAWLEEEKVRTFSDFKLKLDMIWDKNTWPTLTTQQKVLWLPLDGTITQKIMVLCHSCSLSKTHLGKLGPGHLIVAAGGMLTYRDKEKLS